MPGQDSSVILAVSVMIGAMSTAAVVLVSGRLQPIEAGPRIGPHARVAAFHLITELIGRDGDVALGVDVARSEEHTSELQSLMRISYAVFCLNKKNTPNKHTPRHDIPT